jgi:hypothetical protein
MWKSRGRMGGKDAGGGMWGGEEMYCKRDGAGGWEGINLDNRLFGGQLKRNWESIFSL